VLKAWTKAPARALREGLAAVREFGAGALEDFGVSRRTQLARFWWLHLRHGFTPDSFYRYQLYRPDRFRRAGQFLQSPEAARLYRLLAAHDAVEATEIVADKRKFSAWCDEHDLPSARVLVAFDGGQVTQGSADRSALPEADLFTKAAGGYGGHGVRRWRWTGGGYEAEGRRMSGAELLAELGARSTHGPIVLQPYLHNHRALSGLTVAALTTARMVTIRLPGREPRISVAVFRMAVGDVDADNYTQGGIVAPIDLTAGTLGPAVRTDDALRLLTFHTHPRTGTEIPGFRLPCWPEAVRLVEHAHALLPGIAFVGWDVALLDTGPALVEANWNPGVKLTQMPSGVPLGDTDYVRCFHDHLAPIFRDNPPPRIRAWSLWEPTGHALGGDHT